MGVFTILIVVKFSWVYTYVKTNQIIHLKYVPYIVLQLYLNKVGKKLNQKKNKEQQKKTRVWKNAHQTVNISHLPSGSGKGDKNYHLLPFTQLSSLNCLQQAYITQEFKRKSNTFLAPHQPQPRDQEVCHMPPNGPGCSAKQRHLLDLSQEFLGANSHPETMKTVLPQNRDFIYTLYLHSGLGPTRDDCPGR